MIKGKAHPMPKPKPHMNVRGWFHNPFTLSVSHPPS